MIGQPRLGRGASRLPACALVLFLAGCSGQPDAVDPDAPLDPATLERLRALVLPEDAAKPADVTNAVADDSAAAELGQKLFFDPGFSGPLLHDANNGLSGTLGSVGETGRVACSGCHLPSNGSFTDTRSPRGQLSLASGWTHRRTPSLLDVAQAPILGWDGRRATAFSVVFGVIESPLEFNSSRLFVAQRVSALYRKEYESIFGPLPTLDAYPALAASDAGCLALPDDPLRERCVKPGDEDPEVIRVVVNFGKAISAYTRRLSCGPSAFEAWMRGDPTALTAEERAGAALFVGKARCDGCHAGPYLTDQKFHNVGVPGSLVLFTGVDTSDDPGAALGLSAARSDPLGPAGAYSDGDDGRLDAIDMTPAALAGAFRTPSLRCIDERPSYMHNGEIRTLEEVVTLFDAGGGTGGFAGTPEIAPLGLSHEERAALAAFLRSLQGPGPPEELRRPPGG